MTFAYKSVAWGGGERAFVPHMWQEMMEISLFSSLYQALSIKYMWMFEAEKRKILGLSLKSHPLWVTL